MKFNIPGILLDGSTIKLSLPMNQVKRLGTLSCTDKLSSTSIVCTETPVPDTLYNYLEMIEFHCIDGSICSTNTEFQINLSNTENPLVSPADLDPFIINVVSPSGNQIFVSPVGLVATPELEVGPLISLTITH